MRIPRFRIRTLMIAVAVVAIAFGACLALERHWQRAHYNSLIRTASD
jgi:DNA-binding transcriptional regulator of glucitol operon